MNGGRGIGIRVSGCDLGVVIKFWGDEDYFYKFVVIIGLEGDGVRGWRDMGMEEGREVRSLE